MFFSDDDDDAGSDTDETIPDEELMAILEKDIEEAKTVGEGAKVHHTERIKYKLNHKGTNHFDVIPAGWVVVDHISGMPIYLHKYTRSVSLSRPYHIGKASARVSIKFT